MCREENQNVLFPDYRRCFVGAGSMAPVAGKSYTFQVIERNGYCDDVSANGWTLRSKTLPEVKEVAKLVEEDQVYLVKTASGVYVVTLE